MKISLKNIIDLDYLIYKDDTIDSKEDIRSRELKDRKIYNELKIKSKTDKDLLFSWLEFRKNEKKLSVLPGTLFSSIYTFMIYIMVVSGGFAGITTVYSFLAYHGAKPVNVTSFTAIFIILQAVLIIVASILLILRVLKKNGVYKGSIIETLILFIFFNLIPKIIKKTDWIVSSQSLEDIDHTISFLKIKAKEYSNLFFWHFCILTSLFAFSFATSTLVGVFLKVVLSDMAFGWQSTLISSSHNIYEVISFIALPWSWLLPEGMAIPNIEQIEGSRIILKQGILVLTTENLASWWPFLCFGIIFYAVIPRGVLLLTVFFLQKQALKNFNFTNPKFRQLIVRMKSPLLSVDKHETLEDEKFNEGFKANQDIETLSSNKTTKNGINTFSSHKHELSGKTMLLVSNNVYSNQAIENITQGIKQQLLFDIKESIDIFLDIEKDCDVISRIKENSSDIIIIVHEVWQPPIRELLHYITKIKSVMPEDIPLYILLTGNSDQDNLGVDKDDINLKVWEKVIFKLEDPNISVIRFLKS